MKKVLLGACLVSTSFMLFGCGNMGKKATKPNPKTEYVYKGKGRGEEEICCDYNKETCSLNESTKYVKIYDTNGNLLHDLTYSMHKGSYVLSLGLDYEYNEEGKLIREFLFNYNSYNDTSTYSKSEYTYKGKEEIRMHYSLSDSGKWKTSYKVERTYDDNGNVLTEISSYAFGKKSKLELSDKRVYTYNSSNLLISEESYSANNKKDGWESTPKVSHTYTYDSKNNLTKEESNYSGYTDSIIGSEYQYDENNNVIQAISYTGKGSNITIASKKEYTYDSNNHKMLEIVSSYENGEYTPYYKYESTYDSNGNISSIVTSIYDKESAQLKIDRKTDYAYSIDKTTRTCYDYKSGVWELTVQYFLTYKTYE